MLFHNLINLTISFPQKKNHLYLYYFLFSLQKGCEDFFYKLKILSQENGFVEFVLNRFMAIKEDVYEKILNFNQWSEKRQTTVDQMVIRSDFLNVYYVQKWFFEQIRKICVFSVNLFANHNFYNYFYNFLDIRHVFYTCIFSWWDLFCGPNPLPYVMHTCTRCKTRHDPLFLDVQTNRFRMFMNVRFRLKTKFIPVLH